MKIIVSLILLSAIVGSALAESTDDSQYLQSARDYLEKGEAKAAVIQLKNYLKESPFDAEGRMLLGETYLSLGEGAAAVKELEKAQELGIEYNRLVLPLSQAYLAAGRPKMIIDRVEVDTNAPREDQSKVLAVRGMAQMMAGNLELANGDFEKALQLDKNCQAALHGMARINLVKQNHETAIKWANEALKHDQSDAEAWLILGETHRVAGNNQASIKAFDKVVSLDSTNVPARLNRAAVYIADGQLNQAEADIKLVVDNVGKIPLTSYLSGVVAFERKEMERAKDSLRQVLKDAPNHQPSHLLLGTIAYYEGEYKIAQNYLYDYVNNQPDHLPATKLLAAIYIKRKRPEDAVELLEKGLNRAGDDAQYLALLGSAYMQNRQFDKGTELLEKASKIAPDVAAIKAQLAIGHFASGKVEKAVGELENAVDLGQGLVQADVMLVLTLIQQKAYGQAAEKARQLAKKMPDNPMPDNLLGAVFLAQGDLEKARKHWMDALKIQPDYVTAMANLAKLEVRKGRYKEAENWYKKILVDDDSNLEALLGLVQLARLQNDSKKVIERLQAAQEKNPNAVEPPLKRAEYELSKGNVSAAKDIITKLKFKHSDNRLVLRSLGIILMQAGDANGAISTFRELISKDEMLPEPHHLLAQAWLMAKDTDRAKAEWNKVLKLSPNYTDASAALANLAFKEGRYEESLEFARTVQLQDSQASIGYQLEGDAYSGLRDYSKANLAYQSGYQKEPSAYLARRVFQTYRQLGNARKAESKMQAWLKENPDDADSWTLLGMGYQEDGEVAKALSSFETAYKMNKHNPIAVNNLAWLYQELGDSRAVGMAEELLDLAGENSEMTDTAGWVFMKNGREDQAVLLLQQAVLNAPKISAIRVHLAEALIKTGRLSEARNELTALLEDPKDFPGRLEAEALLNSINSQ